MSRLFRAGRLVAAIGAVALVTAVCFRIMQVNPTTVALSYVAVILLIATGWGIAEATAASLMAVLCFNFFFLPPIGRWTIADPQNWVALVAFLLTAVVVSQLSGRARQRNIEALARQRDLERLYAVSRALLLSESATSTTRTIAQRIADVFELPAVALYNAQTDAISLGGKTDLTDVERRLRDAARQSVSFHESGVTITPVRLGGAPIGSLALVSDGLSDTVLQSVANLAAIALERARGQETAARAEAARQSGELRATVLDALAHEFKTPLTSMKAASSDLRSAASLSDRERELVSIIDEDLGRLEGLVTDVVRMLRIDAGDFVVHLNRHRLGDIALATIRQLGPRLDGHHVVNRVPEQLVVTADGELLGLALRQLLDNAVKYSPPSSMIELGAASNGLVTIAVRNSGSVIPEREQTRIFERFYRGAEARHIPGTGIGLSIVQQIAKAHGGSLAVSSTPGAGTEFTLSLPHGASFS